MTYNTRSILLHTVQGTGVKCGKTLFELLGLLPDVNAEDAHKQLTQLAENGMITYRGGKYYAK